MFWITDTPDMNLDAEHIPTRVRIKCIVITKNCTCNYKIECISSWSGILNCTYQLQFSNARFKWCQLFPFVGIQNRYKVVHVHNNVDDTIDGAVRNRHSTCKYILYYYLFDWEWIWSHFSMDTRVNHSNIYKKNVKLRIDEIVNLPGST